MKIIGIIAEYNPLHNGHIYQINEIKKIYPDSLIVAVINGYFTERGNISLISKNNKVKLCLENKIDLVVELPTIYGVQSADTFANIGVSILEKLKVDYICFGSETADLTYLTIIANEQINNDIKYQNNISYPANLLKNYGKIKPNDILAISYIKTIINNKYNIKPLLIKRTNDYLDIIKEDTIISATNIRNRIQNNEDINKYVPNNVINYIENIDYKKLFDILKYKINTCDSLEKYLGVIEGLEYRLKKVINESKTYEELIINIKSKRYTYNQISRMVIAILLDLKKSEASTPLSYIKILGFNNIGKKYLNKIKKNINLSIISDKESIIYKTENKASIIYDLLTSSNNYLFEKSNKIIIKD